MHSRPFTHLYPKLIGRSRYPFRNGRANRQNKAIRHTSSTQPKSETTLPTYGTENKQTLLSNNHRFEIPSHFETFTQLAQKPLEERQNSPSKFKKKRSSYSYPNHGCATRDAVSQGRWDDQMTPKNTALWMLYIPQKSSRERHTHI